MGTYLGGLLIGMFLWAAVELIKLQWRESQDKGSCISQAVHMALLLFCLIAWLKLERQQAAFVIATIAGAIHVSDAVTDLVRVKRQRKAAKRMLRMLQSWL